MTKLPEDVVFALDQIDRVFRENIEESQEPTIAIRDHITRQDTAIRDMLEKGNFGCACCAYRKQEDCEDKCTEGRRAYFMGERGKRGIFEYNYWLSAAIKGGSDEHTK